MRTQHTCSNFRPRALSRIRSLGRLTRLGSLVGDADYVVVSAPESLRYFLGWRPNQPAYLVVSSTKTALVVAQEEAPENQQFPGTIATYQSYSPAHLVVGAAAARGVLKRVCSARRKLRLGVEPDHFSAATAQELRPSDLLDVGQTIRDWRSVKDPDEVAAIRSSERLLDMAFERLREAIVVGATELDLYLAAEECLLHLVAEPLVLRCSIGSGTRTLMADPRPGNRVLRAGELVLVDLYPALDGYVADCSRTFVVGEPTSLQRQRHSLVLQALEATERELRPGVPVATIDWALRHRLGKYKRSMAHHSGHGIGLVGWEAPWIGNESDRVLVAGNVIALEPGLYVKGWGGIRIESNYLITERGAERLEHFPRHLM